MKRLQQPIRLLTKATASASASGFVRRRLCTTKSDMELQRDYQGLIPRILSILNLFGDNDKISALIKLEDKSIVTSGIMRLFTYADLQNPLLIKYDFDPVDFMEGAIHAFEVVHRAIGSTDMQNFANGYSSKSETHEMLKKTLGPQIYKATMEASKEMNSIVDMRTIKFDLQKSHLVSITTDIIEESVDGGQTDSVGEKSEGQAVQEREAKHAAATQKIASDRLGNATDDDGKKKEEYNENAGEEDDIEPPLVPLKYPVGSVVATATVFLKGVETLEFKLPSNISSVSGTESELIKQSRTTKFAWTFRSCISGHQEMDWKIVAFDGFGDIHLR